jgi:dephospho-CoA kinase
MFSGKPIIGIVGGIGSGKSFVADLFGELGCLVIHSDKLVAEAYDDPVIAKALAEWWGGEILTASGQVDKKAVAQRVFNSPSDRQRLEDLLYPFIAKRRIDLMQKSANDAQVLAFIWDAPLLLEAGLKKDCDALVYVDAPVELRLARLAATRRWNRAELDRREILQWPLDKKRQISEYVIDNTAEADYARRQVKDVLSRIRPL